MKTSMTFKAMALIALLGTVIVAPVFAQGGPGMGGGWGGGPCMQNAGPGGGMRNGAGMGPGAFGGRGGRGMMANQNYTRGWQLMTPEERTAYQIKMREVKTYDACVQVQTDHRGVAESRAREKGVTLMTPRMNACDNLKSRGLIM